MAKQLRRVRPGERLSARHLNAIIDRLNAETGHIHGGPGLVGMVNPDGGTVLQSIGAPSAASALLGIVQHDAGSVDGDGVTTYQVTIDGEGVEVQPDEVAVKLAKLDEDGAPVLLDDQADPVIAKAVFMPPGIDDLYRARPWMKTDRLVRVGWQNGQRIVEQAFIRPATEPMVITSGPYVNYFMAQVGRWDPTAEDVVALANAAEETVYVYQAYHLDTLIDDDVEEEYAQPRLTTGDPIRGTFDEASETWLLVGHFRPSTKKCPES